MPYCTVDITYTWMHHLDFEHSAHGVIQKFSMSECISHVSMDNIFLYLSRYDMLISGKFPYDTNLYLVLIVCAAVVREPAILSSLVSLGIGKMRQALTISLSGCTLLIFMPQRMSHCLSY